MEKKTKINTTAGHSTRRDKHSHIQCCLNMDVESSVTTGFEKYEFVNNALPDIDFDAIDTSCSILGKNISAPFIISPMTGGTDLSRQININLAQAAQALGVVMCVGSQRLALENETLADTYRIRDHAPDIPLFANLGAIYLNYGYGIGECERAVDMIEADALIFYLNHMQRVFQNGGKLDFRELEDKIAQICEKLSVPVIVKDIGCGISADVARRLEGAGVSIIDVSGAGGTSWVKVTRLIGDGLEDSSPDIFDNWGIPTADALTGAREVIADTSLIASGGIRSGMDMAKALALGAHYVGMALPLLAPAMDSPSTVIDKISTVIDDLKIAMFGCGAGDLDALRKAGCIRPVDKREKT